MASSFIFNSNRNLVLFHEKAKIQYFFISLCTYFLHGYIVIGKYFFSYRRRNPHRFVCEFELVDPKPAYYAGEIIKGKAYVTSFLFQEVRGIFVTLKGVTKVHWNGTRHMCFGFLLDNTYKSYQVHTNMEKTLRKNFKIDRGRFFFFFEYQIPTKVPSSIEEEFGHTRYEITLVVDSNYEMFFFKRAITVLSSFDLNLNPKYKRKIEVEISKIPFKITCITAYVVSLKIAQKAYAPGQTIKYVLRIDNEFEDNNFQYKLYFVKKVTYRTPKKNRTQEQKIVVQRVVGLRVDQDNVDFFGYFIVPTTAPTTTNSLNNLSVEYYLKASVILSTHKKPIIIRVPVIIGTKPIQKFAVYTREEQLHMAGVGAQRAGELETEFNEAAGDEVKIYDFDESDDDKPTTSQAARAGALRREPEKYKNLHAKESLARKPEEKERKTDIKEGKKQEIKEHEIGTEHQEQPTTYQSAIESTEEQKHRKEESINQESLLIIAKSQEEQERRTHIKKSENQEIIVHEIDTENQEQPTTSQSAIYSNEEQEHWKEESINQEFEGPISRRQEKQKRKIGIKKAEKQEIVVHETETEQQEKPTTPQSAEQEHRREESINQESEEPIGRRQEELERKIDIEKHEKQKNKEHVIETELQEQLTTSQLARTAAERLGENRAREKVHEETEEQYVEMSIYEYYGSEPVYEISMFQKPYFVDKGCELKFRITEFKPVYPVYHSPPPSRRSSPH